jgi:MHS family proline/betaine transporter-like MFS transporter
MLDSIKSKPFFSAALGAMIEYYDYALYSIFMPILAPLFFPAASLYQSIVKAYFIVLLAAIARPIGGLFFGYLGDTVGRRKALLSSMYGIALATLALGIVPTYASIGVLAPLTFLLAKIIQTFCFGGEYNGAGIYVIEHAKKNNEAWTSCMLVAIILFGCLPATLLGLWLTLPFMPDWSWRFAFILGGLIGLLGIRYRKNLIESPHFTPATSDSLPLGAMLKKFPRELIAAMLLGGFATIPYSTAMVFVAPVLMSEKLMTMHQFMWLETVLLIIGIITLIPTGIIADKHSPRKVMAFGSWALILLSYPLLYLVDLRSVIGIVCGLSGLIIINEVVIGPSHVFLKNLFPMQYRYRGTALGYCFGMSVLGSATPLIESYLYQMTNHFAGVSVWLVLLGAGTLISMRWAMAKQHRINQQAKTYFLQTS